MKGNPNFDYLHEKINEQRIILLQGGTRSGKTYATIYFLIDFCLLYTGMEIDLVRDTFTALKATAWKDFKDVLLSLDLYHDKFHNKTDHTYELNGNTISYYGADTPDKIHGRSRDILWINEAHQFPQETIDQLFPRTRYRIIADYNPALGLEHWLDPYIEKHPPLVTTYKDNPFLTQSQIEDIESRKSNQYWWTIYGSGERANRQGAIFTNWTQGDFDNSLPYVYGQDYGFSVDPTTLVKVAVDEKKKIIYADEKFYSTVGMGTNEIFEANKQATKPNELIIADSAEPRLIDDLRRKGTNIIPCEKGAGSVSAGITKMQDYQIVITPTSHNLRKELSNYIWNDKKAGIPVDAFNHCFVGDTLVSTINGDVKIKDIKVGDLVLTSKGYKKVLHLFNNGVQQVENYSMQLDINYVNLCATKIHNVKTNQGWIAISKLQSGQMVYLNKSLQIRNTTFTRMKDTFHEAIQGCTLRFTNCISSISQKVIMFITSIKILGITELKISNWCKAISTYLNMAKKGTKKIQNGLRLFTQKVLKLQNNGTHQVRAKNGTKYKANKLGLIDRTLNIIANFVVKNTKQGIKVEQSIVIQTARLKHLEIGESRMEQVYDIMVDECHEYFANGLLVHNCIDPLRYSTMYLTKHKTSTGIRKNSLI